MRQTSKAFALPFKRAAPSINSVLGSGQLEFVKVDSGGQPEAHAGDQYPQSTTTNTTMYYYTILPTIENEADRA